VIDLQRRVVAERVNVEFDEGAQSEDDDWLDDLIAFDRCLDRLPPAGGRVFFKREVIGEDTETICKDEGISSSNCWVILHRSRIALRACLEKSWFGKDADGGG
jgi:RNA polymerase sigma-70 factor, ECF subfamily